MPILKGVLEQGDPFSARFVKSSKLRWIIGTYLLAAVVLSNGYKNNNVYNMITSRKPLLIETLEDVKSENFSFYVRTRVLEFKALTNPEWLMEEDEDYHKPFVIYYNHQVAREWLFQPVKPETVQRYLKKRYMVGAVSGEFREDLWDR